jgi:hypothetical protein
MTQEAPMNPNDLPGAPDTLDVPETIVTVVVDNYVNWPPVTDLGLDAFDVTIERDWGSGQLSVWRVPKIGESGGWDYAVFYNTTEVLERPACDSSDALEIARIRFNAKDVEGEDDPDKPLSQMSEVVEYVHPAILYKPITGNIGDGEDPTAQVGDLNDSTPVGGDA